MPILFTRFTFIRLNPVHLHYLTDPIKCDQLSMSHLLGFVATMNMDRYLVFLFDARVQKWLEWLHCRSGTALLLMLLLLPHSAILAVLTETEEWLLRVSCPRHGPGVRSVNTCLHSPVTDNRRHQSSSSSLTEIPTYQFINAIIKTNYSVQVFMMSQVSPGYAPGVWCPRPGPGQ